MQPTHVLFMSSAPRTCGFSTANFPSRGGVLGWWRLGRSREVFRGACRVREIIDARPRKALTVTCKSEVKRFTSHGYPEFR